MFEHRILTFRDAESVEGADSPVSGGIGAVLARSSAARGGQAELDTQLLAASDDEIQTLSQTTGLSIERLSHRREQLNRSIALSMQGAL
jgi:hypothetical protein